jgi:hypothetical protein
MRLRAAHHDIACTAPANLGLRAAWVDHVLAELDHARIHRAPATLKC